MFAYNPNQNKEGDASHELGTKGSSMISMITILLDAMRSYTFEFILWRSYTFICIY